MSEIRLGSLFDGIGVFPLAAVRCGIVPAWASEIEKAPISITKRHFPGMAHLGDVTKLNGGDIPPVHIITFGSPCQNLSQIGNRAGLAGEKSSLFFHAIRIIREMREATNGIFPAIAVWENVMGAFFSNDRMDFRAVLSAFTAADISMPASGRWTGAGMVRGHTPDLAWRLMDAQHWASPRLARRQRVFVVADFGGQCSHEILFKPRAVQSISASGGDCWLSAACGDRGSFIEAGRRVPITRPFQCYRIGKYITNRPPEHEVPESYLDDETFAAILKEAEKYLGFPYVWGGSSPSTSFDCSGFVSYVYNQCGWSFGRLGAQGLYNICSRTSSPRPGDLVFFVGTYDTAGISHVGIYVGDGWMLHCGDPISYANLNSSYWQSHLYAYGRLP